MTTFIRKTFLKTALSIWCIALLAMLMPRQAQCTQVITNKVADPGIVLTNESQLSRWEDKLSHWGMYDPYNDYLPELKTIMRYVNVPSNLAGIMTDMELRNKATLLTSAVTVAEIQEYFEYPKSMTAISKTCTLHHHESVSDMSKPNEPTQRVISEEVTLTCKEGNYNWENMDDDLKKRLAFNSSVLLESIFCETVGHDKENPFEGIMPTVFCDDLGYTHAVSVVRPEENQAEFFEQLVYAPLWNGTPVIISLRDTSSDEPYTHAVATALAYNEEKKAFYCYVSWGRNHLTNINGWYDLTDVVQFDFQTSGLSPTYRVENVVTLISPPVESENIGPCGENVVPVVGRVVDTLKRFDSLEGFTVSLGSESMKIKADGFFNFVVPAETTATLKVFDKNSSLVAQQVVTTGAFPSTENSPLAFEGEVASLVPSIQYISIAKEEVLSTIMFDANGGIGGKTVTLEVGTALTVPTVEREGYTFMGWSPVVPEMTPATDTTYTAQWKANQYTVTFDADGGSGGKVITQDYGTKLTAPTVTRDGYTFVAWLPAVPETVPAKDTTYVAQWKKNTVTPTLYTITFDANGGVGGTTVTQAAGTTLAAPTVTREGYTFVKWEPAVPATTPAQNMTYVAQWKENVVTPMLYTITFNANGGSGGKTVTQAAGTTLTAPTVTREGYTFVKWEPSVPATTPAQNMTYTAQWKKNTVTPTLYTITFNANGGVGGTTVTQAAGTTLTAPTVTREGYTFVKWEPAVPATTPATNTTYVAQWKKNTVTPTLYTITFDANGGTGGKSVTQAAGTTLTAPTVRREGYTFVKWEPSVPATTPATNATYVAQWKKNTVTPTLYTITFDANGGVGGTTVTQATGTTLTAPTVTREGYTFVKWEPSVPATTPAANTTYVAQWKENVVTPTLYTITFDANGGTGGKSVTQAAGTTLTVPTVTREGYTFVKWEPAVPATTPATNATYTAQWEKNTVTPTLYTITFNANGGVGGTTVTQAAGTTLTAPTVTREGYTFVKWEPAVPATTPATNATYVAQWKKSSVDLSLLNVTANFKKGQVTINGCFTQISGHLEIPEWIVRKDPKSGMDMQLMVVGIGNGAFQNQAKLEKVTLPNTITSIGKDAFKNCVSLDVNAIVMPNQSKLKVGKGAFTGCKVTAVTAVPGEPKAGMNVAGYKVATSVSGFKLNAKLGTWTATFKKPGTYEAVLFKPSAALKAVRINVGAFPIVTIKTDGADDKCSVKGAGAYLMGKKVSLSAKASKEKIFLGFYDEKGTRLTAPGQTKYSFVMLNKNVTVTAKFTVEKITIDTTAITQAQWRVGQHYTILLPVDAESGVKTVKAKLPNGLKLTKMMDKWYVTGSPKKAGAYSASFTVNTQQKKSLTKFAVITVAMEDVKVGVDLLKNTTFQLGVPTIGIPITAHSPSGIKSVKASKLPAGMKVQNVNGQWIVTGTPKKAGTYYVTLTITTKAGSKWVQVVPVIVAAYPTWMAGYYEGPMTYSWYEAGSEASDMLGYVIAEVNANGYVTVSAMLESEAYSIEHNVKAEVVNQTTNSITLRVPMHWYGPTGEYVATFTTDLVFEKRGEMITLMYRSNYSVTDYMTGVLSRGTK